MNLLELAIQAIDDREARLVLRDALLESGWRDGRAREYWNKPWREYNPRPLTDDWIATLSRRKARAIAAVLLCGGWPEKWDVGSDCKTPCARCWATPPRERCAACNRYSFYGSGHGPTELQVSLRSVGIL